MKFRVEIICTNNDGSEQRSSLTEIERQGLTLETLGLTLSEGKTILSEVQGFITSQQTFEYLQQRRKCPICGQRYPSKQRGQSTLQTVFGPVAILNPRWESCGCQTQGLMKKSANY